MEEGERIRRFLEVSEPSSWVPFIVVASIAGIVLLVLWLLGRRQAKRRAAISSARGPDRRTIALSPAPAGELTATMVSERFTSPVPSREPNAQPPPCVFSVPVRPPRKYHAARALAIV